MNEKIGNGTSQACASCKYQRRKCHPDCFLAPYFPANRSEEFLNAHRLFGVSNITKILNSLEPEQRNTATETIIFQSKARKDDPVQGCVGIIRQLISKIEIFHKELDIVNQQLSYCRQQEQLKNQQLQYLLASSSSSTATLPLQQHFGNYNYQQQPAPLNLSNEMYNNIGDVKNYLDPGCSYYPSSSFQEFEDIKPFDIKPNDRITSTFPHKMAIMNFKDTEESSAESVLREKQVHDHVLEGSNSVVDEGFSLSTREICKKEKQIVGN